MPKIIEDEYSKLNVSNSERYRLRHPKEMKKRENKRKEKLYRKIIKLLGSKCTICSSTKNIVFHEIHGRPHPFNVYYISNHIEDFIPMCRKCHNLLHRLKNLETKGKLKLFVKLLWSMD